MAVPPISTRLYTYHLPDEKIAKSPLAQRDHSKLLVFKNKQVENHIFNALPNLLDQPYTLVFNNTKVISARLKFKKVTGATVEVFLLEPEKPTPLVSLAMAQKETCAWRCLVGNLKKWNQHETLELQTSGLTIKAKLIENGSSPLVEFSWIPASLMFFEVVEEIGFVPLPPYLKRDAEAEDKVSYQTIYASVDGAVAAPTAGLHFTQDVLTGLTNKGHSKTETTLHVSAGTFLPLKAETASSHDMHVEQVAFSKETIKHWANDSDKIIAVGTTSMRALESLYWFGIKIYQNKNSEFFIPKGYAYEHLAGDLINYRAAFNLIVDWMDERDLEELQGSTEIFIVPGYDFKVCKGLITNFHQPDSTLLMLVAAFVGDDWKLIYDFALNNEYRFLSYGDSSLLFKA